MLVGIEELTPEELHWIEEGKKELGKLGTHMVACYGIAFNNTFYRCVTHVCHNALSAHHNPLGNGDKPVAIVSKVMNTRVDDAENHEAKAKAYYDWLINRSPYAHVFIDKTPPLDSGFFIASAYVPHNMLLSALIATRSATECVSVMLMWYELVERGINENLAYILSHIGRGCDNYNFHEPVGSHHTVFYFNNVGLKTCRNFVAGRPAVNEGLWGNDVYKGVGVNNLFGCGGIREVNELPIRKSIEKLLEGRKVEAKQSLNPFPLPKVAVRAAISKDLSYGEAADLLVEVCHKLKIEEKACA